MLALPPVVGRAALSRRGPVTETKKGRHVGCPIELII